jgi:hypothetical protein
MLQWKKDLADIEAQAAIKEEEASLESQLEVAKVQAEALANRSPQGGEKPPAKKKPSGGTQS